MNRRTASASRVCNYLPLRLGAAFIAEIIFELFSATVKIVSSTSRR